jgi:peptidylprolyl isomerase
MRIAAILIALTAAPLLAQTSAHPAAAHHTATTAAAGGCVHVPAISPKIPALPPGSPCPKALYTITHIPTIRLDYGSPLLSPALRTMLDQRPETFSLDYVDTKVGTGPLAEAHKWYTVHYSGYLLDGTRFDSSVERGEPISFPYGAHRVIEGWDTGFEGMHVGGKRRLYVPYQLGYGENVHNQIPAKAELVFDLELIAQSDTQPTPPKRPVPEGAPGGRLPDSMTHPNGAAGTPKPSPAGTAAPPPVTSTTPSGSTQPAKPSSSSEPK